MTSPARQKRKAKESAAKMAFCSLLKPSCFQRSYISANIDILKSQHNNAIIMYTEVKSCQL